jgi:uncharacterized protein YjdB
MNFFTIKQLKTLCATLLLGFAASAQQSYCTPTWTGWAVNEPTEPITLVQLGQNGVNGIDNTSTGVVSSDTPRYEDFSAIAMNVTKGQSYTLVVKGNTDGNNINYITVYFDWNGDGTFSNATPANEAAQQVLTNQPEKHQHLTALVNSTGADALQVTHNVVIPTDAFTGSIRMRIVKNYNAPSNGPCSNPFIFGQVEDYTLTIAEPVPGCPSLTELYENFDTLSCCALGLVPTCWESILVNGSNQIISGTTPASGTSNVYMNGYGADKIAIVVLPHFSNVSAGTHQFRFKVRANSSGGLLDFGYITDTSDETTFVTLEAMTINNTTYNSTDAERVFIVPATVPAGARLAIRNPGTSWAGMYWDDVYWEPIAVTSVTVATQNNVPATIVTQGGTRQLVATVNPLAVSQNVTWSIVSGAEYATVDANGLVTATGNGTVTVRATSVVDNTKYDDIEIVISYTIAVQSIVVTTQNNVPATVATQNGTLQLVATVNPANATNQNVTWSIVSGAEYATVDANGLVTATGNGTVVVRATSAANTMLYGEITLTISYTIAVESLEVSTQNNVPAEITEIDGTLQLVAAITPADADNQEVVWSIVSGAEYATVDANGLVTAANNGTVVIRATSAADGTIYDEITIILTNQLTCQELHPGATEPVTLVNFAGINNESAATVGGAFTENFMSVTGTAERGQEYTLTVKGNTNGDFAHTVTAYIDWNQDMDFSDENEVYEVGTLQNTTGIDDVQATLAITVPETAALGNATLRIVKTLAEGEIECNTALYGQTEYYTLTVTGAAGTPHFEANSVSVYPNPVADVLNIETAQDVLLAEVYSAQGQKVLAANSNAINVSGLASGIYVVRVVLQNGASQNIKIVKQ